MRISDWSSDVCSSDLVAKILAGKEFKGIGPKLAEKIATKLGADLISILNRGDPGELLTDLIGEKKAKALLSSWGEKMPEHAAHAMLAELGVGPEIRKRTEEQTSELQSLMRHSYAVFCLKNK